MKTYYLESTTDDRAIEIPDDDDMRVVPSTPSAHECGVGRFACTLKSGVLKQARMLAKVNGFTISTDSMLAR